MALTKKTTAKKTTAKKASVKTSAKKVERTVETRVQKATTILRKGALAYVGLHGAAYEQAKIGALVVRSRGEVIFGSLIEKGEEIETQASRLAKTAQKTAAETFEDTSEKVKSFVPANILPFSANDRVSELEAEVTALNKKISTLSKKPATPRKKVAKIKTEKTPVTPIEKPIEAPVKADASTENKKVA